MMARRRRQSAPKPHTQRADPRGLVLRALINTVFMAANVYLGLKVALTLSPWRRAASCTASAAG